MGLLLVKSLYSSYELIIVISTFSDIPKLINQLERQERLSFCGHEQTNLVEEELSRLQHTLELSQLKEVAVQGISVAVHFSQLILQLLTCRLKFNRVAEVDYLHGILHRLYTGHLTKTRNPMVTKQTYDIEFSSNRKLNQPYFQSPRPDYSPINGSQPYLVLTMAS